MMKRIALILALLLSINTQAESPINVQAGESSINSRVENVHGKCISVAKSGMLAQMMYKKGLRPEHMLKKDVDALTTEVVTMIWDKRFIINNTAQAYSMAYSYCMDADK
ncbi:MAG: hypothetical protein OQL19_17610 [Gammaproteobacteria bacterium]|nr:hypothetical protein [Gammaproteobacteria bacterium]